MAVNLSIRVDHPPHSRAVRESEQLKKLIARFAEERMRDITAQAQQHPAKTLLLPRVPLLARWTQWVARSKWHTREISFSHRIYFATFIFKSAPMYVMAKVTYQKEADRTIRLTPWPKIEVVLQLPLPPRKERIR